MYREPCAKPGGKSCRSGWFCVKSGATCTMVTGGTGAPIAVAKRPTIWSFELARPRPPLLPFTTYSLPSEQARRTGQEIELNFIFR